MFYKVANDIDHCRCDLSNICIFWFVGGEAATLLRQDLRLDRFPVYSRSRSVSAGLMECRKWLRQ